MTKRTIPPQFPRSNVVHISHREELIPQATIPTITAKPDRIDIIAARALIERQATALEAGDIDAAIHLGEFVARVSDDGLMRFIEAMRS